MLLFGAISALTLASVCLAAPQNPSDPDAPWLMFILVQIEDEPYGPFTEGSLVHPRAVLTVAKALSEVQGNAKLNVSVAASNQYGKSVPGMPPDMLEDRAVVDIIIHEKFQPENLQYNFALLILKEPFDLKDTIKTIGVSHRYTPLSTGCYAVAFAGDRLLKMTAVEIEDEDCEQSLQNRDNFSYSATTSFCTDDGAYTMNATAIHPFEQSVGTPMVCPVDDGALVQVGFISRNVGRGNENQIPIVWSKVSVVAEWIDELIETRVSD